MQVKIQPHTDDLGVLRQRIVTAWDELEPQFIRNAAASLPRRAQLVINAQGKPIPRRWL